MKKKNFTKKLTANELLAVIVLLDEAVSYGLFNGEYVYDIRNASTKLKAFFEAETRGE